MSVSLCIHGHFYQPPRENPWYGLILPEASAAPSTDWNTRILRESYSPLAFARRLDSHSYITDIMNCYEWISFNAGPTLLQWMRVNAPETLARMQEGDKKSIAHFGHGNAIAQIYHHIIMPLATKADKRLEVRWAIADFIHYFGRHPEGMWLSECAVDTETLEVLHEEGIAFVILAPRQAKAVRFNGVETPVNETSIPIGEPYFVELPSGGKIAAIFYHGELSQKIAFDGLLRDGEMFWQRIVSHSQHDFPAEGNQLMTLATDGETYGHHFMFGEMALAYVLTQGRSERDAINLTNIAAFLHQHPPKKSVVLHEPSSWSCVHGVERWRSNCGCSDGGHGVWNQKWRAPLRDALNIMKEQIDAHFDKAGTSYFNNPREALLDFGSVLANPSTRDSFAAKWFIAPEINADICWKLLAMQEMALASFASCAWFFDEISRIEPENAMTYALRAMEFCSQTGGPDIQPLVTKVLDNAKSNIPKLGTGKDIFMNSIVPRQENPASLCLFALIMLYSEGKLPLAASESTTFTLPNTSIELTVTPSQLPEGWLAGTAFYREGFTDHGRALTWRWKMPSNTLHDPFIRLATSELYVEGEATQTQPREEWHSTVADFARSVHDYLTIRLLTNFENQHRSSSRTMARHVLSVFGAWEEYQHTVTSPKLWSIVLPYLVTEAMLDTSLTPPQVSTLAQIFAKQYSEADKALASKILQTELLKLLDNPLITDAHLAAYVEKAQKLLPDVDWWQLQNIVWVRGIQNYPVLADKLGFTL